MAKKIQPVESRRARWMICDENGGHEATERELVLQSVAMRWAATGQVVPPEVIARAARAYDESLDAPSSTHTLDLAQPDQEAGKPAEDDGKERPKRPRALPWNKAKRR